MTSVSKTLLSQQWQTMHNSYENYEQYALIIKLITVVIAVFAWSFSLPNYITLALIALLWLQEAIWKTFQSRAETAIIAIEDKLAGNEEKNAEQLHLFYSQWQSNRTGVTGLIAEYLKSALRPTVIYPYGPLILMVLIF